MGATEINVGDTLPPFTRPTGFEAWNRYAAVNDEFVGIHMDDEAGRAAGLPGAIGMGNLQWSYLHSAIREWVGDAGRIVRMSCQFRSPNLKGQTVIATGRVVALEELDQAVQVSLEVWTEDEQGKRLSVGTCAVAVDCR